MAVLTYFTVHVLKSISNVNSKSSFIGMFQGQWFGTFCDLLVTYLQNHFTSKHEYKVSLWKRLWVLFNYPNKQCNVVFLPWCTPFWIWPNFRTGLSLLFIIFFSDFIPSILASHLQWVDLRRGCTTVRVMWWICAPEIFWCGPARVMIFLNHSLKF